MRTSPRRLWQWLPLPQLGARHFGSCEPQPWPWPCPWPAPGTGIGDPPVALLSPQREGQVRPQRRDCAAPPRGLVPPPRGPLLRLQWPPRWPGPSRQARATGHWTPPATCRRGTSTTSHRCAARPSSASPHAPNGCRSSHRRLARRQPRLTPLRLAWPPQLQPPPPRQQRLRCAPRPSAAPRPRCWCRARCPLRCSYLAARRHAASACAARAGQASTAGRRRPSRRPSRPQPPGWQAPPEGWPRPQPAPPRFWAPAPRHAARWPQQTTGPPG
mmetsp:Transcript_81782/g.265033  ORF Transcript_81782/g.265033 Transcript_81782/m.265033 type:complete len:272 (+) Transcript_81782:87-902(+)